VVGFVFKMMCESRDSVCCGNLFLDVPTKLLVIDAAKDIFFDKNILCHDLTGVVGKGKK